jgi:hypothetical protein
MQPGLAMPEHRASTTRDDRGLRGTLGPVEKGTEYMDAGALAPPVADLKFPFDRRE